MSDIYMRGTMTPKSGRKSKDFGQGRVCIEDGCERVLSRYNDNKQCFNHAPKKQPRVRGHIDPRNNK